MVFPIVDVAAWRRGEIEPGGEEEKFWLRAPEGSKFEGHWLFKPRRVKKLLLSKARREHGDSPDVLVRGDDWAEKICYELALLLDVPAAVTELARAQDRQCGELIRGSMSRDLRLKDWHLTGGATVLSELDDQFDTDTCVGHTPEAVRGALDGIRGPIGTPYQSWEAFDVFAGYLLFDAWIVNTDRHPRNWAVLQSPTGTVCLAASFDHGSALGSGAGDQAHAQIIERGVEGWCEGGRARTFDRPSATTLVELAVQALDMASDGAREHWVRQITAVERQWCDHIVGEVPGMSQVTCTFVREVLAINKGRIRDAI